MKYKRKAQASIEFLTTYGWVFIILLLAIAILINYGFLNPSKYLPERFDFGEQLKCEEFFLDINSNRSGEQVVAIKLRNNFVRPINITKMYVRLDEDYNNCSINATSVAIGKNVILACTNISLTENIKNKIYVNLVFKRNESGTTEHNISGLIFSEPANGEYCFSTSPDLIPDLIHCHDNVQDCGETGIDIKAEIC